MNLKTTILCIGLAIASGSYAKNVKFSDPERVTRGKEKLDKVLAAADTSGLTVNKKGVVLLNGKVYRGIGVNYFSAFYRTVMNSNDLSYKAGLKYLSDNHIPFIRFAANGFWPKENLYLSDSVKYFKLMDAFVHTADSLHVGLVPSLFFNTMSVCDNVGEHQNQWGQLNSKTIALMRRFTTSFVKRYKNSRAIWGWEFGNEMNAYVDLFEQSANFLPKKNAAGGTPAARTIEDAIRTTTLDTAYREFARVIRLQDPKHFIFTGNAMPEWNMWHRHANTAASKINWLADSDEDYGNILDAQNPAAIGTITIHFYHSTSAEKHRYTNDENALMAQAMATATSLKRPLFVGEFGSPLTDGENTKPYFETILNAIIDNKVPLSALWVFDFPAQSTTFNATATNTLSYQIKAIVDSNTKLKAQLGY